MSLEIGEKYEVSPTLATSALDSSLSACYLGALVIAFMVSLQVGVLSLSFGRNQRIVGRCLVRQHFQATFTFPAWRPSSHHRHGGRCQHPDFRAYREELRAGKVQRTPSKEAMPKRSPQLSTPTSTLITASILIWLGTGPVKGFGVTLAIGIVTPFRALFTSETLLKP